VTYKDVRDKASYAPWVMYRRFMDFAWAEGVEWSKKHAREADPGARLALANTFGPNPFSGRDYYLLCKANDYWMEYSCETRSPMPGGAMRYCFDTMRSFSPGVPNHPWIGYRFDDECLHYAPWWTALHGATGVSPYGALSLGPPSGSWAVIFPTLQHTRRGDIYAKEFHELKSGIGKLLMTSKRTQSPIAILWSQPSMYVAWAMSGQEGNPGATSKKNAYSQYFMSRQAFRYSALMSGRQFDYVSEEQIMEGALKDYRALALPAAYAISEATAKKIVEFVREGGVIVADMGCGLTNESGKPYADGGPLEKLLCFKRKGAALSYDERKVQLPFGRGGQSVEMACVGGEDIEPGVECVRDSAGKVCCVTQRLEKGRTVFLNCAAPWALETGGVWEGLPRITEVTSLDGGKRPKDFEAVLFENGEQRYLAVLHDYMNEDENYPVRLRLPQKPHVYDVRTGKYLGEKDFIEADILPGGCAMYALLPYQVQSVKVQCENAQAGKPCKVECEIGGAGKGSQLLHVEVTTPSNTPAPHYSRNVVAENGRASFAIPFAFNDPAGDWKVEVCDVASGVKGSAAIQLREAGM
jgi:hypothetical protein